MTNLEYLRTLEAEDLAQAIKGVDECETCTYVEETSMTCCGNCVDGFIEWLKQERDSELKPCPFCGGKASAEKLYTKYIIGCTNESCRGFLYYSKLYKGEAEAIEAWNKRAE